MALVLADRVKDSTTSTGTGAITLANSPPAGFQSFATIGNGNTTYYTISGGSEWEVGIGTYTSSGTTLSRDTVFSSSNSGSLVDFSAGAKDVFVTLPSQRSYGIPFSTKSTTYTASPNEGILADTSGGPFTITLPASPVAGTQVIVGDAANTWGTNNLTLARNGSTIEGAASDLTCDITGVNVQLIYSGTTWQVFTQAGGAGGSVDINTQTTGTLTVSRGGTGAATLSANAVLLGNGTSALQTVAPGTSGNVLTSNGTTWASTAPAGGGSLILLQSVVASNSATVTLDAFSSTYDNYVIYVDGCTPVTNSTNLLMRVNSKTADYSWVYQSLITNSSTQTNANANTTGTSFPINIDISNGLVGGAIIDIASRGTSNPIIIWRSQFYSGSASARRFTFGSGGHGDITALSSVTFLMAGGNISVGNFRLYGIKKS